uniref:Uncharacterized protein n=1 Tax=Arundo donax TaxID=35708 RepID=A0A0A9A5V2_ARUDO
MVMWTRNSGLEGMGLGPT